VPKSRMREDIPPLPNTPSWRGAQLKKARGQLYLYLCISTTPWMSIGCVEVKLYVFQTSKTHGMLYGAMSQS